MARLVPEQQPSPAALLLLGDLLKFTLYGPADGAVVSRFIFGHEPADLAYIIVGFTLCQHIVHGLFVKVSMPAFHVPGP